MPLPIQHQAPQQVGSPDKRRLICICAPEDDVISAAGADVTAVQHELVCAEPAFARFFVKNCGRLDRLSPVGRRVDVDLNHSGSGVTLMTLRRGSGGGGYPSI